MTRVCPADVQAGLAAGDSAVEGAFYAWDTNGGDPVGTGVLRSGGQRSYASLAALPEVPQRIVTATIAWLTTPGTPGTPAHIGDDQTP